MLTCSEWDGDMSPLPKGADTRVLTSCTDVYSRCGLGTFLCYRQANGSLFGS